MTWTDEKVTELLRLRAEGLSRSQTAARLGITRGAVCGKLWWLDNPWVKKEKAKPECTTWERRVNVTYAVWKAERKKERELGLR